MNEEQVKPDEKTKQETEQDQETLDFTKPDFVFVPKGRHEYRQAGPYLICKSCFIQHAVWIGMDKLMVGESKNGEPIIKSKKELGM